MYLKSYIDSVKDQYDLIIFDCSPTDSMLTESAYMCSDFIVIPVRPEYLSSIGLPLMARSLDDFKQKYHTTKPNVAGIVFNATEEYAPEEQKSKQNVIKEAQRLKIPLIETEISYSRSYPKGARENAPIFRTSYSRINKTQEFFISLKSFQE
jgi:chromosome partitioning protein